jgi:AcrR family transcriptional regulator
MYVTLLSTDSRSIERRENMRIVKDAKERRNEILDAADELFNQKGFDHTSTNDILDKVGIARGTLYYHFKSKEDIMDALIKRYHDELLGKVKMVARDKSIPAGERIIAAVMAMNISDTKGKGVIEHIHKPQNALMHQKIQKLIVSDVTPILAEMVCEGIKEGLFNTPFPYECIEMLIVYTNAIFDEDSVEMTDEERVRKIQGLIFNIERLLDAKSGSFKGVLKLFEREGQESS